MLGNAIRPYFLERFQHLLATDFVISEPWMEMLDVRNTDQLETVFRDMKPTLVLHLAACTDLEFCEVNPDIAEKTNATATGKIAALCEQHSATLVYISTAGVFDGVKDGYYTEDDEASPTMVYGHTKLEGERLVRANCSRHFIVRAGWMVGGGIHKDKKFVHHILGQVVAGAKTIRAVNDLWGTPTYTHDFALNLFHLLASRKYGLYHMVCEGSGTRYDVAREILDICGCADIELLPVESSYFKERFFVPRPRSEMMINANLQAIGLNFMRPWKDALRDYIGAEFSHAKTGAEASGERRLREERRRTKHSWKGPDRRHDDGRRAIDASQTPDPE